MKYHVAAGDALADELKKIPVGGELIVCRECLMVGDADAESLNEFWDQRALFVHTDYGEDEIEYHEKVAEPLARILDADAGDEVVLWFEYELFCSANMWFCLWMLNETNARVFRVEPAFRSANDRWLGFGRASAAELRTCLSTKTELSSADISLGADLWRAYRTRDAHRLLELGSQTTAAFPYLAEVCSAAGVVETRPAEILGEIIADGITDFDEIFAEFTLRAGVYGFGDLQVQRLLDQLSS